MKKLLTLAMVVTLATASVALAAPRPLEFAAENASFASGAPSTTANDDSCDIANAPAATLLLPVFEVDFNAAPAAAVNTVFTIVNTSAVPQIAHITLWTDRSFPVLDFNVFLTGYDVQGISLYDIIARGLLPGGGNQVSEGSRSEDNIDGNPFFAPTAESACDSLPTQIPDFLLTDIRTALTAGTTVGCGSTRVGQTHTNAIGYVTIDVGNNCSQSLPTSEGYYTGEMLFDNVLIGDYQRINPISTTGNNAGGETLVPIRAIPEGGPAGSFPGTNLPYTFYDRYTPDLPSRQVDRRQPLPSTFAARFIAGGTGNFGTRMAIWREGITADVGCLVTPNGSLAITEIVRFDESENPTTFGLVVPISPVPPNVISLPEASLNVVGGGGTLGSSVFPSPSSGSGDVGGWIYLNLNNGGSSTYSSSRDSQNWVTVQLTAEGRMAVDFDAAYLGNGCSPAVSGGTEIGPAPNFSTD